MPTNRDIVVMGGSMGAFENIRDILTQLPVDFPASIFIVQHTMPTAIPLLANLLSERSLIPVNTATDKAPYLPTNAYCAVPDFHLIVDKKVMFLSKGPRENNTRPAIDPLFRSAAVAGGPRVVGIVLSGLLDDGSAGLSAIKRCSGTCVVLDPGDATYPDMPRAALNNVDADHVVPVAKMGALLNRLVRTPVDIESFTPPEDLAIESRIAHNLIDNMDINDKLGEPSHLTCPECGGTLWKLHNEKMERYRCHVGHAYSELTLADQSNAAIDRALLASLRALEERARLYQKFADEQENRGNKGIADSYHEEADNARDNAQHIRLMLLSR